MPSELPEPWRSFLAGLDRMISSDVVLHCLGGFVVTACYGLPRPTGDLDVVLVLPSDSQAALVTLAGKHSELHKRHGVHLDVVTVATYPGNYEQRLIEIFPGGREHIRLFALDPYDLVLAKLERNLQRDRDDFAYLAQTVPLDLSILRNRYHDEMRAYLGRPDREDVTLQLWIDIVEERRHA
jgi:hypothetical protein